MSPRYSRYAQCAALVLALGCATSTAPGRVTNALETATDLGAVRYREGFTTTNTVRTGRLAGESFAFELDVLAGSRFDFEVTQLASSRALDTQLYVYERTAVGWVQRYFDDDGGYARLSKIKDARFSTTARYLVVLKARNRGDYRLTARCTSNVCLRTGPFCPEAMLHAISACAERVVQEDGERIRDVLDAVQECVAPSVLATPYNAVCNVNPRPSYCRGLPRFVDTFAAVCARDGQNRIADGLCTFGSTYREALTRPWQKPLERRMLTPESARSLTSIEAEQLVAALHVSAHDEVNTAAEAIAAADQDEVTQIQLWDASMRRAFTVYEYGAGDNSYGAFFEYGISTLAAQIQDGDIYQCTHAIGAEQRRCQTGNDCREGLGCFGIAENYGVCVAHEGDDGEENGRACREQSACGYTTGFMCTGLSRREEGMCLPSWMQGHFRTSPGVNIPDNSNTGVSTNVLARGLATVDVDVWIDLRITHPRISDLRVFLRGPGGVDAATEVVIFNGAQSGNELNLRNFAVRGLPGDESVNGVWTLRVVDTRRGQSGVLESFALRINSRWD